MWSAYIVKQGLMGFSKQRRGETTTRGLGAERCCKENNRNIRIWKSKSEQIHQPSLAMITGWFLHYSCTISLYYLLELKGPIIMEHTVAV